MPRPRFEKLDVDKREAILEVAAQTFAEYGYEAASLNQILTAAGLSKGAAYYYFDDKADLFATAVEYYYTALDLDVIGRLQAATPETFWSVIAEIYRQPFLQNYDAPWKFGVLKAAQTLPPDSSAMARLAPIFEEAFGWVGGLVQIGQSLGVIRDDIPPDLLMGFIGAVDAVSDTWLLAHMADMSRDEVVAMLDKTVDVIRGMLAPGKDN
jgi:AcrR family transcriptional regulator